MRSLPSIIATLLASSVLALLCIAINGQENGKGQAKPEQGAAQQQIICEREYTNFAFGRVRRGIYVDDKGGVYSYTHQRGDPLWSTDSDGTFTEEELMEKYNHGRELVARVKGREVNAKRELILKASTGPYSEKIRRGADQGTYSYACYLYDAGTARYRSIRLRTTGDQRYENLSAEAKTLTAWLDSLAKRVKRPSPRLTSVNR